PVGRAIEKGIEVYARAYETDEPMTYMKRFLDRKRNK
ncbi:MAG: enoyl-CoA hydratase, partial [Deltaproteobacteria bacterium]|nr:enoyl-CoA hydratase [Deltaproteobacteria bacterium]